MKTNICFAIVAGLAIFPRAAHAGGINEGPLPDGRRDLYGFNFDDPRGTCWEGFRETKNTFGGSAGAARAPRWLPGRGPAREPSLALSWPLSGCRYGLPDRIARNYDHSKLPANRCFSLAYYVEQVSAIRLVFFNATRQKLMSVVIDKPKQKKWTRIWFNLLEVRGGEPIPEQAEVGDRLTQVTVRATAAGKKPLMILDEVLVFELPGEKAKPPARRVLPGASFNKVKVKLMLAEPAVLGPADVGLSRWPGAREIAVTWLYDQPVQPDKSLWLAKTLARHGWKGTWLLRGNYPEAVKMIPELEKLGMEIGALPRSSHYMDALSYAESLDEAMMARLSLAPHVKSGRLLSFENPDDTHRGGYQPFWVGTFTMRAVRDSGFLVQNTWGKYCYLGWLKPPYPKWGGDISDCMIQHYVRRPGPRERVNLFPGRPHEHYGWEENYTQPLNGAREIYGKINEFENAARDMPKQFARLLQYTRRYDLGKLIVLKTLGIRRGSRSACEKVLASYGKRDDFWYATLGEIGTYEYLRSRCRVVPLTPGKKAGELELTLEMADVNPPWVRQPLTVEIRRPVKVRKVLIDGKEAPFRAGTSGGTFDVPLTSLLRQPLKVSVRLTKPTMTVPDKGMILLLVTNPGRQQQSFEVDWLAPPTWGWRIDPYEAAVMSHLKPGQTRTRSCGLETTVAAGLGRWPVVARLSVWTQRPGEAATRQYQYVATDLTLAPRVFVKTQPWLPLFIPPKGRVKVRVYVSRDTKTEPLKYGAFARHRLERFICQPGPASGKGTLTVRAAPGFKITPSKVALDLPAKGSAKHDFIIENTGPLPDPQRPLVFKPRIELAGIGEVKIAADPVRVYVDPQLAYKPLDDRGLVLYASFDGHARPKTVLDPKKAGQRWGAVVLRRPGRGRDGKGAPAFVEGKKGQAVANASAWYGTEKNFNPLTGSILFWWRMPAGAEAGRYNLINVGGGLTGSWYTFWTRYEKGRLIVSYVSLGPENHVIAAKWPKDGKWHHVALTWDFLGRHLRVYVDGKLAGEDKDAAKEWLTTPFQLARHLRDFPGWKDYYKGEYGGSPPGGAYRFKFGQVALSGGLRPRPNVPYMDELYVFDRALTRKQIDDHVRAGK